MERPKLTAEHRRLEALAGSWHGRETIAGAPHTNETAADGTFDSRVDLDGFFLITDYVERAGGKTLLRGHGVIGWDPGQKTYTLHWFDVYGSPPASPSLGRWDGDTLTFENGAPPVGRTIFELADDELVFRIEMNPDQQGWKKVIEGRYRRGAPAARITELEPEELPTGRG
jgi:uncharacterized protein DUF1579